MRHGHRSVAVFRWAGELPRDCGGGDPERLTTLAARAPAEAVLGALRSRGYRTDVEVPYDGEGGWHFTVDVGPHAFGVFTHWTGIAGEDSFAVQLDLRRGAFAALFRKRVPDGRLEPACRALDEAFASLPRAKELRWLSDEQFANSY